MIAKGHIFLVNHQGTTYYYLPSQEKWVKDMKLISLGDIYFDNFIVRSKLGNPNPPKMEDYSFENEFKTRGFKMELL